MLQALCVMNDGLAQLIYDYQGAVRAAVALLESSGIPKPATRDVWAGLDIPHRGGLQGGVRYFKHGYGCAVNLPSGKVDFDFGAEGQIDGFDLRRLIGFAEGRLSTCGFSSEQDVKLHFNQQSKVARSFAPTTSFITWQAPMHNPTLKFAPFGRWDAPSARPLATRYLCVGVI